MTSRAILAYNKQSALAPQDQRNYPKEPEPHYDALAASIAGAIRSDPETARASKFVSEKRKSLASILDPEYVAGMQAKAKPLAERYVKFFEANLDSPAAQERLKSTIAFYSQSDVLIQRLAQLIETLSAIPAD